MILLMIIGVIWIYYTIASFTINKVYEKTQSIKYKRIVIAIFLLIPTWDIIIGYPIYQYYCYTQSGEKIYKTVEDVDGIYTGTWKKEHDPVEPSKIYKYVDYKEKESGKYFRSYWLDSNTSKLCVQPRNLNNPNYKDDYTKAYMSGKCIAKQEIPFEQISRYGFESIYGDDDTYKGGFPALKEKEKDIEILWVDWGTPSLLVVPILGINKGKSHSIYDRADKTYLQENSGVCWNKGILSSLLTSIETGNPRPICDEEFMPSPIEKILKPSKGAK